MAEFSLIPEAVLVGRRAEQEELADTRDSGRPELVAVYGRRRVGKTYLVRTFFAPQLCFELTGVRKAPLGQQLRNFAAALEDGTGLPHRAPRDWTEAFGALIKYLEPKLRTGRTVAFFDELPWLAGPRSGFLPAFEHFWNSWGSRQANLIVVICGSAASWMIAKVLHERGGLHNRVTRSVPLRPFRLREIEAYLRQQSMVLDRRQVLELAMAVGGIPYYLNYVRKGRSAAQNIDAMFFSRNAPLKDEFDKLFAALFEDHGRHLQVIRALARRPSGLSRNDLLEAAGLESGGTTTAVLAELEASGFIARLVPFGREMRDALYRLIDEFALFHLKWLDGRRDSFDDGCWTRIRGTPAWQAWSGYSFESLCFKHVSELKDALGIAGVQAEVSSWRHQPKSRDESGAQIDMLIDRRDGVINVCEMKFGGEEFIIEKRYAEVLRRKLAVFRRVTQTRKSLFLTMVTAFGVKANMFREELVQNTLTADVLFGR